MNALLDHVERSGADLIVVGSHSRQGVERLLGPVSELLVRTATCSVLVASSKSHSMIFHKAEHSSPSYPRGEVPATARPLPVGGLPRRS